MILDTVASVGKTVRLNGWVNTRRDMGKITFIDLRDRSGIAQIVFVPSELPEGQRELIKELRPEFVLAITGEVKQRDPKQVNPNIPTGTVEILAKNLVILNRAKTPPFELDKDTREVNEEVRLKYRYLDLRTPRMLRNLVLRDRVITHFRDFLHARGFIEVETPYLYQGTPEGARVFGAVALAPRAVLRAAPVAAAVQAALMVAGVEKYFQIARCFRDEDQRGDRQPEFTQLDLEMSFVEREDVLRLIEEMMIEMVKACTPEKRIQQIPFPRLSYQAAMDQYGSDKPDLREDKTDPNLLAFCWVLDFPFFERTDDGGWTFSHNPFSAPKPEHMEWLMQKENIPDILTTQYDIVLNGYEAGGGSIRNHTPEALRKVFEILGLSNEDIEAKFGHARGRSPTALRTAALRRAWIAS